MIPPAFMDLMRGVALQTMTATVVIRRMPKDRTAEAMTPASAPIVATTKGALLDRATSRAVDDDGRAITTSGLRVALPHTTLVEPRDYLQIGGRLLQVIGAIAPTASQQAQVLVDVSEVT